VIEHLQRVLGFQSGDSPAEKLHKLAVGARLRSGFSTGHVPLPPLGIPATSHDALMARLDRLGTAKEVAQLGATLGPEFTYEEMNQPQGDPMRKMT
jgi:hypothetical protein